LLIFWNTHVSIWKVHPSEIRIEVIRATQHEFQPENGLVSFSENDTFGVVLGREASV
jgi:hypothetical protein